MKGCHAHACVGMMLVYGDSHTHAIVGHGTDFPISPQVIDIGFRA